MSNINLFLIFYYKIKKWSNTGIGTGFENCVKRISQFMPIISSTVQGGGSLNVCTDSDWDVFSFLISY